MRSKQNVLPPPIRLLTVEYVWLTLTIRRFVRLSNTPHCWIICVKRTCRSWILDVGSRKINAENAVVGIRRAKMTRETKAGANQVAENNTSKALKDRQTVQMSVTYAVIQIETITSSTTRTIETERGQERQLHRVLFNSDAQLSNVGDKVTYDRPGSEFRTTKKRQRVQGFERGLFRPRIGCSLFKHRAKENVQLGNVLLSTDRIVKANTVYQTGTNGSDSRNVLNLGK